MTKLEFWTGIFALSVLLRWTHWHGARPEHAEWHKVAHFALHLQPLQDQPCTIDWHPATGQPVLVTRENGPLIAPRLLATHHPRNQTFDKIEISGYTPSGFEKRSILKNLEAHCFLNFHSAAGWVRCGDFPAHFPGSCENENHDFYRNHERFGPEGQRY